MRSEMDSRIARAMAGEPVGGPPPMGQNGNFGGPPGRNNFGPTDGFNNNGFPPRGPGMGGMGNNMNMAPRNDAGFGMQGPPGGMQRMLQQQQQPGFGQDPAAPPFNDQSSNGFNNGQHNSFSGQRSAEEAPLPGAKKPFNPDEFGPDSVPGGRGGGIPTGMRQQLAHDEQPLPGDQASGGSGHATNAGVANSPTHQSQRPITSTNAVDRIALPAGKAYNIDTDDPFGTGGTSSAAPGGGAAGDSNVEQEIPWGPEHPLHGVEGAEELPPPAPLKEDSKGAKETSQVRSRSQ